ncbi:HAMP domain-containing histidine kinase [Herbiconiux sp. VKM Ac-2851]|nr:HAMP domain-containing histidine kinase [Herbiconiux sp. VKM Ac-2851]
MHTGSLPTGSLRTRTVLAVLGLLAVLLVGLGLTVQLVLGERLRAQIEERLADRAAAAAALIGTVSNDELADRLSAQGVSVLIESPDGAAVVAGPTPDELRRGPDPAALPPLPGPAPSDPGPASVDPSPTSGGTGAPTPDTADTTAPGTPDTTTADTTDTTAPGTADTTAPDTADTTTAGATVTSSSIDTSDARLLTLRSELSDGSTLTLTADTATVGETLTQLRWIMLAASAAFLVVAAGALVLVVRRSLRPLETMTALARDIGDGDRGRRLHPTRPRTEIGRTARAFDEMLDGVEGAERAARDAELVARDAEQTAREAEAASQRSELVAVEAERRVRAFVSDAAHELRTPVAGMRAAADTLVRASVAPPEQERLAMHVVREAARAGRLIDDMLLMARLDEGLTLALRPIGLREVAAAEVGRQRIRRPALELRVEAPEEVPAQGDPERLGQVVANLVDNASRMTGGRGPVTITLSAEGRTARLEVADEGPGVPAADRERIFDRLVRLDASRDTSGGGSGLGLPIARAIARAHGGDLTCAAPRTPGARFVLTLPAG